MKENVDRYKIDVFINYQLLSSLFLFQKKDVHQYIYKYAIHLKDLWQMHVNDLDNIIMRVLVTFLRRVISIPIMSNNKSL